MAAVVSTRDVPVERCKKWTRIPTKELFHVECEVWEGLTVAMDLELVGFKTVDPWEVLEADFTKEGSENGGQDSRPVLFEDHKMIFGDVGVAPLGVRVCAAQESVVVAPGGIGDAQVAPSSPDRW
jgi:hypothetical protein